MHIARTEHGCDKNHVRGHNEEPWHSDSPAGINATCPSSLSTFYASTLPRSMVEMYILHFPLFIASVPQWRIIPPSSALQLNFTAPATFFCHLCSSISGGSLESKTCQISSRNLNFGSNLFVALGEFISLLMCCVEASPS